MNFEIEDTALPEVKIIRGKRFHDERGFFSETYKVSDFTHLGLPPFVQDNMSESKKGVIRGLHWQEDPHGQGKLVQCLSGSIIDVAVDVRHTSSNFGKHVSIELTEDELKFLWVPIGFAHGFQALSDNTKVSYKVTNYWVKEAERSIRFNSFDLSWPIDPPIISQKDGDAEVLNIDTY